MMVKSVRTGHEIYVPTKYTAMVINRLAAASSSLDHLVSAIFPYLETKVTFILFHRSGAKCDSWLRNVLLCRWLFKGLGRHKAEELLMQSPNRMGAFIVRESESQPGWLSFQIHSSSFKRNPLSSVLSSVFHPWIPKQPLSRRKQSLCWWAMMNVFHKPLSTYSVMIHHSTTVCFFFNQAAISFVCLLPQITTHCLY